MNYAALSLIVLVVTAIAINSKLEKMDLAVDLSVRFVLFVAICVNIYWMV